jgi:hypothetical protein
VAQEPVPEPEDYERLNRPVRGEYFTGDIEQPRQYCVWECVDTPHESRPRGRVPKPSCGSLCITYTAKHWGHYDWQGVCSICGKKPRLSQGRILAAFTLRHDAQMYIHRFHSWRRFNQIFIRFWKEYFHRFDTFEQYKIDNKADFEMLMMLYAQGDLTGYQKLMHHYDNDKERDENMFSYNQMSYLNKHDEFESCEGNVRPLKMSTWGI